MPAMRQASMTSTNGEYERPLYTCGLCTAYRTTTKRNNVEQHLWGSHREAHGNPDSVIMRYRASLHKAYVAPFVKRITPYRKSAADDSLERQLSSPMSGAFVGEADFDSSMPVSETLSETRAVESPSIHFEREYAFHRDQGSTDGSPVFATVRNRCTSLPCMRSSSSSPAPDLSPGRLHYQRHSTGRTAHEGWLLSAKPSASTSTTMMAVPNCSLLAPTTRSTSIEESVAHIPCKMLMRDNFVPSWDGRRPTTPSRDYLGAVYEHTCDQRDGDGITQQVLSSSVPRARSPLLKAPSHSGSSAGSEGVATIWRPF